MEIRVEESLTGADLLDRLIAKYGSEKELESQAATTKSNEIKEDFFTYRLLRENPERLGTNWKVVEVSTLQPKDLGILTEKRLLLLDVIQQTLSSPNVTHLAHSIGRDKKNVSRDLAALEKLGLVLLQRSGREAIPRPAGNIIRIDFRRGRHSRRPTAPRSKTSRRARARST